MVQAKLELYGGARRRVEMDVRILQKRVTAGRTFRERLAGDPEFRARWIEASVRGRRAATSAIQFKKSALQAIREREILRLLPKDGGMRISDLHGRFVQVCAEKGWLILGLRQFKRTVDVMAEEHRVWTEVRSFGRAGRTTIVYAGPPVPPQADSFEDGAKEVSLERR